MPAKAAPATKVLTFEGEARSGKGTSVQAVRESLVARGRSVLFIDQGVKFRTLAKLARDKGVSLDDQAQLTDFLLDPDSRRAMLELLDQVTRMERSEIDALLYTPEVTTGSAQVGANPNAHPIVIELLFDQVRQAVQAGTDIVLIDGRRMEHYGRQMADEGVAQFVLGFYFRCDAAIAARRVTGIFVDMDKMNTDEKLQLLDAITKVSDRNRQDVLRSVDPMLEPANAYPLHTAVFQVDDEAYVTQAAMDALLSGIVSINTSYTRSVAEMTEPVVALASRALALFEERTL